MNEQQAAELLKKYLDGTATGPERAMVERWYEAEAAKKQLSGEGDFEHLGAELWAGTLERAGLPQRSVRVRRLTWYRVAAAVAVLLAVGGGLMFYLGRATTSSPAIVTVTPPAQVLPGSNKAVLTLGNGDVISLNDAANGEIAQQGGARISKTQEGQLLYEQEGAAAGTAKPNTISTPRGGHYRIDLPDGTRVWLNAASRLTFPPSFAGLAERRVELSGEAYFEVAKDAARPFKVISQANTVEVLGTAFNINAYNDEPDVKTTLVQGAVKVNGSTLRPGQQAVLHNGNTSVREAETAVETAWKNGEFIFSGQDFKTVMRMISRWYDVDVVYETEPRRFRIGGEVSRNRDIREVLKMLEVTGNVKFTVEGRTVKVIR